MATRFLLVPVAVEALVTNKADLNATEWSFASKNYSELARLASIEPPPFTTGNGQPRLGVTVHWALPDALTRGRLSPLGSLVFPTVPNRWLVVRLAKVSSQPKPLVKAVVIESDVLGNAVDPHTGRPQGNPYPAVPPAEGLTRLGHKRELTDAATPADASVLLTALGLTRNGALVGAADPAFAAYVPNVDNVFSYVDDLADFSSEDIERPASLSYMVIGWYEVLSTDPLNDQSPFSLLQDVDANGRVTADGKSWQNANDWAKVMKFFNWTVGDEQDLAAAIKDAKPDAPANATARDLYPSRILCHGMVYDVKWTGLDSGASQPFYRGAQSPFAGMAIQARLQNGEAQSTGPSRKELPQIAIGNSIVDALAGMIGYLMHLDDSGTDIATLFQALEYGLVTNYDRPDGRTQLDERIHQEWFSSQDGGSWWEAVPNPAANSATPPATATLTAAQQSALDQLNAAQQKLDQAGRDRQSSQLELYSRLWRSVRLAKLSQDPPFMQRNGTPPDVFYKLGEVLKDIKPIATDEVRNAKQAVTGLLGPEFQLKENKMPRFWRPADPVVVVYGAGRSSKHGGDGRFDEQGKLFCRLSGQEVRSVQIDPTDASKGALSTPATFFAGLQLGSLPAPIPDLLNELVLLNPAFAPDLAGPSLSSSDIKKLQQVIWADFSDFTSIAGVHRAAGFSGVRPSPVAVEAWAQPWAPLYLSWRVTWFPTNPDPADAGTLLLGSDWHFNGIDFDWTGFGKLDESAALVIEGRSILASLSTKAIIDTLTGHLSDTEDELNKKIQADPANADASRIQLQSLRALRDAIVAELGSADLVAQPLTGFHDRLILRDPAQYFNPPKDTAGAIVTALQDGPRVAPVPDHFSASDAFFCPMRGGHFRLDRLWVVDGFGQVFDPVLEAGEDPRSFAPLRGSGLVTTGLTQRTDTQALQLPPRLVQPARLQFRFVDASAAATAAGDVSLNSSATPVCGWLLPNHLDHSLTVLDEKGNSLGAVLLSANANQPLFWEPTIAGPFAVSSPAQIGNPHLNALILQLFANTDGGSAFNDLMAAIDSTLWTTEPLGKRGDHLSVLIGRPIAVVRARLLLEMGEAKATRQFWEDNALPGDSSMLDNAVFPVRLGHVDQRDDGTLGYFAPGPAGSGPDIVYRSFLAVQPNLDLQQAVSAQDRYVQAGNAHGDLRLRLGEPLDVTLLLDPRGSVHARCGILPTKAIQLPARYVTDALQAMNVSFRVGPLLNEIQGIRMPLPVNVAGSWSWIARTGVNLSDPLHDPLEIIPDANATDAPGIAPASQQARLTGEPIHIREGYLKLSDAVGKQ